MTHLTAIILTYNEEEQIPDCIDSLGFADRVVVFDSFSADNTVAVAEQHGADIFQHRFENYAWQRNAALETVAGCTDWVLFVDADERVGSELADEIPEKTKLQGYAGWRIPRHNYIFGVLTTGAGWYPDYQTRLLRAGQARFDPERLVHEVVQLDGAEGTMKHALVHHNYKDLAHFLEKQERYLRYDVQMLFGQGIEPKLRNFVMQPLRQFFWRFITLHGYRDRWHGFKLSMLMAWYEFRKYRLLASLWREKKRQTKP